jgi:hypothetical protein
MNRWRIALAASLFAAAGAGAEEPAYDFKLTKPDDSIAVGKDGDRVVFTVTTKSGIGGATIRLTAGRWPRETVVRFRYAAKDKDFTTLESFGLATARLTAGGVFKEKEAEKTSFVLADADGATDPKQPAAGSLDVTAKRRDGALELTLPANLFAGSAKVELSWVDFFR